MNDVTARLALPLIAPGQAQKEMTHNEALARLDIAVQASVVAIGAVVPPTAPEAGQSWIVGAAPTAAWIDHAHAIATWTTGGWRFVAPTAGFRAWVIDSAIDAQFVDGAWTTGTARLDRLFLAGRSILSSPVDPITTPSGGTVVDSEARATIAAVLAALRHHKLVETA